MQLSTGMVLAGGGWLALPCEDELGKLQNWPSMLLANAADRVNIIACLSFGAANKTQKGSAIKTCLLPYEPLTLPL